MNGTWRAPVRRYRACRRKPAAEFGEGSPVMTAIDLAVGGTNVTGLVAMSGGVTLI